MTLRRLAERHLSQRPIGIDATRERNRRVTVNPKHPPQPGATYTALTFGSLNGSFTSHTAGFTLTTGANNIQVTKQ